MSVLEDKKIIKEIECGSNFGYVINDNEYFAGTDYKVLLNQNKENFINCIKLLYNGKIMLYYTTYDYVPLSEILDGISSEKLLNIIINMFGELIDIQNNGFLQCQNIDISWNKIFVDLKTLKIRFVYLPVSCRSFVSDEAFQSTLRSNIVKLIDNVLYDKNDIIRDFTVDLSNGMINMETLYNKYKEVNLPTTGNTGNSILVSMLNSGQPDTFKLVTMNAPLYKEYILNGPCTIIGKNPEVVDVPITFNDMISRKHCSIYIENGQCSIEDEDSSNGTYINGNRIAPHIRVPLNIGDIVRMANSDFQLVEGRL